MNRTLLVLAAAAVVLASHGWALLSAKKNRADTRGGTLELTERELRLPPMIGDSTALLLELNWAVPSDDPDDARSPAWLNEAKLSALGFDLRVAPISPNARDHYAALSPLAVFLVLEFEGEAWKAAERQPTTRPERRPRTRLFVVDAGRDPDRLRQQYPDGARHAITRGAVRLSLQDRPLKDGTPRSQPRLRGWIEAVLPGEIAVPPPHSKTLQTLRRREEELADRTEKEPRFTAKIAWGAGYLPWVQDVRVLSPQATGTSPL